MGTPYTAFVCIFPADVVAFDQPQFPNAPPFCSGLSGLVGLPLAVSSILRSACSTLALRRPFGPFFFGGCRYAHLIVAFLHGPQGSAPSHLTLRFLQQSHALRKTFVCVVVLLPSVSGLVSGPSFGSVDVSSKPTAIALPKVGPRLRRVLSLLTQAVERRNSCAIWFAVVLSAFWTKYWCL